MPYGYKITPSQRSRVIDLNAQVTSTGRRVLTFRQIAARVGICERSVALIVRDYAGQVRRWERENEKFQNRLDELG